MEVEGAKYMFKEEGDTTEYNCKDNCVYNKVGTEDIYCFGVGASPAACTADMDSSTSATAAPTSSIADTTTAGGTGWLDTASHMFCCELALTCTLFLHTNLHTKYALWNPWINMMKSKSNI